MTPEYQRQLDKMVQGQRNSILKTLVKVPGTEEGAYFLCTMAQDLLNMLFSIIRHNMPVQEAKANFKIAVDQVLLNYGMSIQIFEFGLDEGNRVIQ